MSECLGRRTEYGGMSGPADELQELEACSLAGWWWRPEDRDRAGQPGSILPEDLRLPCRLGSSNAEHREHSGIRLSGSMCFRGTQD